ncbi:TonB family protein [Nitrospira sp. M1]
MFMTYHITSHKKMSRQSILSWAGSFVIHGLMVFLALELMTHVTPAPSSKPLQWNVSLMNPLPAPHTPQSQETVKHVTPTHRAAISRSQPKTQVTQHRRRTRQAPAHQVVHRSTHSHVTTKAYTPQRALPKSMVQTTAQRSPLRQVTATTHNTVRLKNSTQQQTPVVTSPSGLKTQTHTTSTKPVSQSVKTSSSVQHSQSNRSGSMSRPEPKQKNLHTAIYAGKPDSQPARRVSAQPKPVSTPTHKVVSRPQSSRNTRVASPKLSPEVLAFLKRLREKIQRHREYPRVAKRLGYHGVTTVAFSLSQGGNLTLLQVSEPSGHDILDQAALDAIKKVMPLKPPSMMGNAAIEIPVSFELRR